MADPYSDNVMRNAVYTPDSVLQDQSSSIRLIGVDQLNKVKMSSQSLINSMDINYTGYMDFNTTDTCVGIDGNITSQGGRYILYLLKALKIIPHHENIGAIYYSFSPGDEFWSYCYPILPGEEKTIEIKEMGAIFFSSLCRQNRILISADLSPAVYSAPYANNNFGKICEKTTDSATFVRLKFTPFLNNGARIYQYDIYRKAGSGSFSLVGSLNVDSMSAPMTNVSGVEIGLAYCKLLCFDYTDSFSVVPGTAYTYRIYALNSLGISTTYGETTITPP